MGESSRIYDDALGRRAVLLEVVYESTFGVGLKEGGLYA
jgi:hypothetical protein